MATNTLVRTPVGFLGSSMTALYTTPADTIFTIGTLHLCNTSAANRSLRIAIGGTGAANAVLWDFTIGARDAIRLLQGDILTAGDILYGICDLANAVTIKLSGIERT